MKGNATTTTKTMLVSHSGDGEDIRVRRDSPHPAEEAANILARRMYGRRGTVVTLRLDSWNPDHGTSTWEAFIGRTPTPSEIRQHGYNVSGQNVWIYVAS